ncbi:small vasohibin-binding protein isoform X1 [Tachyglossus aculeatus]|uniref:small vasohibin-binding protein isoform X1 n=1 Tax=Tachyglossus aculeatus TaxID=9261 RepID=UPI0018F3C11C|nr:small vasohibin-binding protein isoform X1 [Tachyglossus aculeatus]XP_038603454.1 small vasohibin-binding protein isoform X1 [Tachyglossus aculeatus]
MDPSGRKEKPKAKEPMNRLEKAKQKSAQQELKQRQRAELQPPRWGLTITPLLPTINKPCRVFLDRVFIKSAVRCTRLSAQ